MTKDEKARVKQEQNRLGRARHTELNNAHSIRRARGLSLACALEKRARRRQKRALTKKKIRHHLA